MANCYSICLRPDPERRTMAHQELLTLWTVRVVCLLYVVALAAWMAKRPQSARVFWSLSFLCYGSHVLSAFNFQYHWSHDAAFAETARQTAAVISVQWGGGLYINYLFTAVWALDVFWIWWDTQSYQYRDPLLPGIYVLQCDSRFWFPICSVVWPGGRSAAWWGLGMPSDINTAHF